MMSGFVQCFLGGMVFSEMPPGSVWQGLRKVPPGNFVSQLAAGEQVGHHNLSFVSRMNKAVVMFLKDEPHVH